MVAGRTPTLGDKAAARLDALKKLQPGAFAMYFSLALGQRYLARVDRIERVKRSGRNLYHITYLTREWRGTQLLLMHTTCGFNALDAHEPSEEELYGWAVVELSA